MNAEEIKKPRAKKLSRNGAANALATLPLGVMYNYRRDMNGVKSCGDPELVVAISQCLHSTGGLSVPYPKVIEDVRMHSKAYFNVSDFRNLEEILDDSYFVET